MPGDEGDKGPMIDAARPFVLFDDASAAGLPARLYADPVVLLRADALEDVVPLFERLRSATGRGLHAAGFLAYEAGYALEPRLEPLGARLPDVPLAWFGLFTRCETIAASALSAWLPDHAGATAAAPVPAVPRALFEARVEEAQALIAAGEIYQANLTFPNDVRFSGAPLALYAGLRRRARAPWGGVVFTGEHWLLSASPELFFTLEEGTLTARPMKGTAKRGADREADKAVANELASDPKQRAENLMIVDLIRNDLSRVSRPGSVEVPRLFEVETYPSVHQLTSTVTAALTPGLGPLDVLEAIFPCGSITGAPKIRAMQAIAALEDGVRGAYTGSMGWIEPGGDAAFNVMIRTLTVRNGSQEAVLGLGAGIVADSRPADEWRECLAKGAFVTQAQQRFDLIETMRFDAMEGFPDLENHLARLTASAAALGFAFDRHDARNELQAATFSLRERRMVRLRLSRGGSIAIEIRSLPKPAAEPANVALQPLPVAAADFRLRHKTSDRRFYDEARQNAGCFETLFVDPQGFVTEGSFTNLFVERDGFLLTPALGRGLLPGILRQRLIEEGKAREADLRPQDLGGGFWIGNAVRGLIAARLESYR